MSRRLNRPQLGWLGVAVIFYLLLGPIVGSGFAMVSAPPASSPPGGRPLAAAGAPTISGTVVDGATLTASVGIWTSAKSYQESFQWQRCQADGSGCVDVPGATSVNYQLGGDDVGQRLQVVVTATNPGRSISQSALSGVVQAAPPSLLAAP